MEIAVIGGGHGCHAAAADLSERGHRVRLWRRDREAFAPILERSALTLTDFQGTRDVSLELATTDLTQAVTGAELVLIPLPATAQVVLGRVRGDWHVALSCAQAGNRPYRDPGAGDAAPHGRVTDFGLEPRAGYHRHSLPIRRTR